MLQRRCGDVVDFGGRLRYPLREPDGARFDMNACVYMYGMTTKDKRRRGVRVSTST